MCEAPQSPLKIEPDRVAAEIAALAEKMAQGRKPFGEVKDEDVVIAATTKDEVWRQDKVTLYRYRPLAEPKVRTPVLIVYGLIGRYTMADLQEDRSLVRNLLKLGVDLYLFPCGQEAGAARPRLHHLLGPQPPAGGYLPPHRRARHPARRVHGLG